MKVPDWLTQFLDACPELVELITEAGYSVPSCDDVWEDVLGAD